ncbi:hypothetical protein GA0061096_4587 [Fictibacillus enclensis]|nr:hypothetical protein GA0061096_4587 [Fictibacillus enclensis]
MKMMYGDVIALAVIFFYITHFNFTQLTMFKEISLVGTSLYVVLLFIKLHNALRMKGMI